MNLNLPLPVGTLLLYYGAVFISLLAVYAVGWAIKALFFKIKEPVSAFSILTCSVLGLAFIVTIYSLIMTKGLTVNWMLVALALLYVYYYRKNGKTPAVASIQPHNTSVWKYVCILLTINALFFCYFMSLIIDFDHGMFQKYHCDFESYAKLSQYLNLGYENAYYMVYNFAKYIPPTPFHFFELWTNAIIYKAFGLNAVVSYMVSLPLFFTSLIFLAFLAIIEIRKKPTFVYILSAFVLLLMVDIIPYLHSLFPIIHGGAGGVFFQKLSPIFLFSITAMVCFLSQKRTEAYFLLLAIPVINLLPIIGVWGTIGALLLWDIYHNHKIRWQYWTPYLVVGSLYLLYVIQAHGAADGGFYEPFHWGLLRLYITQPILFLLVYLHCILLCFLLDKKYLLGILKKTGIIFGIMCFLTVSVSIFMRSHDYNATQFIAPVPIFVYIVVTTLSLIIATSIKFTRKKKYFFVAFCALSLWMSCDRYKNMPPGMPTSLFDYESKILDKLPPQAEYHIGFYFGGKDKPVNTVSGYADSNTIPDLLDYYYNAIYHYSINIGTNEEEFFSTYRTRWIASTPYKDYYFEQKKLTPDISDDAIRLGFIAAHNIEYIRIFKDASPSDYFLSHLTLWAEDEISGERFYAVNNK